MLIFIFLVYVLIHLIKAATIEINDYDFKKTPIVFFYKVNKNICEKGIMLPDYIRYSIDQAVLISSLTNSSDCCNIVLITNLQQCNSYFNATSEKSLMIHDRVYIIDTNTIRSNKTMDFEHIIRNKNKISDKNDELWISALTRFFYIEDFINYLNLRSLNGLDISSSRSQIKSVLHVESDNLIYGNISLAIESLRKDYPHLAVTPLNFKAWMVTASIFWISNLVDLQHLNQYIFDLNRNRHNYFTLYLNWLKNYAHTNKGSSFV